MRHAMSVVQDEEKRGRWPEKSRTKAKAKAEAMLKKGGPWDNRISAAEGRKAGRPSAARLATAALGDLPVSQLSEENEQRRRSSAHPCCGSPPVPSARGTRSRLTRKAFTLPMPATSTFP